MIPTITLPFAIPYVYRGFATATGVAILNSDYLILEFEVKDSFLGFLQSGVRVVQIPLNEVVDAELKPRLFSTQIQIQTKSFQPLQGIPEKDAGEVVLNISKRHRDITHQFIAMLKVRLFEIEFNTELDLEPYVSHSAIRNHY